MTNNEAYSCISKTDEDQFWEEIANSAFREVQKSHDEPAKQIITVSGVLQGLYFVAISFSTLKDQMYHLNSVEKYGFGIIFMLPVAFWLLSLCFAVNVLMPKFRTGMYRESPSTIQKRWKYDINSKVINLWRAQIFLMAGLIFLIISIYCYLFLLPTIEHSHFYNNSVIINGG